jgi:hypothetical protein
MMRIPLFTKLHAEGYIPDSVLHQVKELETNRLFSLYWELRLALYLGVLLLTGGLGILVYKHIDSIGHQAVLAFIGFVTAGSFGYCFLKKTPFSWGRVNAPDAIFDYVLLLGSLGLLIFLGYLQYEYGVFGDHYGMATFIPMVILFAAAYYFDHLGVLSVAITNLAAWVGIAITPLSILKSGNFGRSRLVYTGILLGVVLLAAGWVSVRRRLKAHFELTYTNFGLHLFFIASLSGLFRFDDIYVFWFMALTAAIVFFYIQAMGRRSVYFAVVILLYAYIAVGYMAIQVLSHIHEVVTAIAMGLLYFVLSAIGMARWFISINHQLKAHDSL